MMFLWRLIKTRHYRISFLLLLFSRICISFWEHMFCVVFSHYMWMRTSLLEKYSCDCDVSVCLVTITYFPLSLPDALVSCFVYASSVRLLHNNARIAILHVANDVSEFRRSFFCYAAMPRKIRKGGTWTDAQRWSSRWFGRSWNHTQSRALQCKKHLCDAATTVRWDLQRGIEKNYY